MTLSVPHRAQQPALRFSTQMRTSEPIFSSQTSKLPSLPVTDDYQSVKPLVDERPFAIIHHSGYMGTSSKLCPNTISYRVAYENGSICWISLDEAHKTLDILKDYHATQPELKHIQL